MKRLRWHFGAGIRFFHCGEYGEQFARPHYHALIFGVDFEDKSLFKIQNGSRLYVSPTLTKLWGKGHCSIGDVTFQSAGYVARYVTKKITGDAAKDHYWTDPDENGEIFKLAQEYTTQSRRPGIAYDWYYKFKEDIYPHDNIVIDGRHFPVPRYYDKLLEKDDPDLFEQIKLKRQENMKEKAEDNTPERLAVKHFCLTQRKKRLIRPLEKA